MLRKRSSVSTISKSNIFCALAQNASPSPCTLVLTGLSGQGPATRRCRRLSPPAGPPNNIQNATSNLYQSLHEFILINLQNASLNPSYLPLQHTLFFRQFTFSKVEKACLECQFTACNACALLEIQDHPFSDQTRFMLEGSASSYRLPLPPSAAAVSRVETALASAASAAAATDDNAHQAPPAFLTGVHESDSFSSSRVLDIDRLAEPLGAVVLRLNGGDCCGEMGGGGGQVCELQLQNVTIEAAC